jgi:hypothetical protein
MQKIKIGLCMAGAVSAGAYTAGVIDYLLETLERWEKAKEQNQALGVDHPDYDHSIPMHSVEIGVLSGASAGGMTAIIAARALLQPIEPASYEQFRRAPDRYQPNNAFYDTWVNMTELELGRPMMDQLLDTSDMDQQEPPKAVLNSNFIDHLAQKHIQAYRGKRLHRLYLAQKAEVAVTFTNLNGIQKNYAFRSSFQGSNSLFTARQHLDFGHFILQDLSEQDTQALANLSPEQENQLRKEAKKNHQGKIPVLFSNHSPTNIDTIRDAAMATGAFPLGLAFRKVTRNSNFLIENPAFKEIINIDFSTGLGKNQAYETVIVDGGMLNNEPFEITKFILDQQIKRNQKTAENSFFKEPIILMIDPFPSEEMKDDLPANPDLLEVLFRTWRTMRSQLLFKPDLLEAAADVTNSTRFIIAPARRDTTTNAIIEGNLAIACGALSGFGGFLDIRFRRHDFFLGRKNAQSFLQKYFAVSSESQEQFGLLQSYSPEAQARFVFPGADGRFYFPIIPDMRLARPEPNAAPTSGIQYMRSLRIETPPEYGPELLPKITLQELSPWLPALQSRLKQVLHKMLDLSRTKQTLANLAFFFFFDKIIRKKVQSLLQKDFSNRGMLK